MVEATRVQGLRDEDGEGGPVSGSALVVEAVVRDFDGTLDVAVTEAHYSERRRRAAKRWGVGCMLSVRIEPADEAWKHAAAKHLYGHLYTPVSARHGETVAEVHLRMKANFMPDDGRTSITQLNEAEMKSFIESVEQDIRENDPDSWDDCVAKMALYEKRKA
jgi:hypothetical protein